MTQAQILLSACAALALAACGGQSSQPAAASAASTPAAASAASSTATSSLPQTDALNIYNWSNYVDESTVSDFAKAQGIKLNYDLYENNETLEAKMLTGKSGYDLVVPGIAPDGGPAVPGRLLRQPFNPSAGGAKRARLMRCRSPENSAINPMKSIVSVKTREIVCCLAACRSAAIPTHLLAWNRTPG